MYENSYYATHQWMRRHYPLAGRCDNCGTTDRRTERAQKVQGVMTRDPADWLELCKPCHTRHDGVDVMVSKRRAGTPLSGAHRAGISSGLKGNTNTKGRPLSAEHRASIAAALKGKPKTEAHRAAMRRAATEGKAS